METKDIVLLAVTLLILGEVSYLLAKLPKTSIKAKDRIILVDTSVLMDGRITTVAATGFIGGTLVIPRTVIGELQLLADGSDNDKRARARYGLDVVAALQKMETVEVEILQDGSRADEGVDERLLTLAKRHHAVICTLDFNLNKVAAVEGIQVLNLNELAQSLRMSHLPGDQIVLDLVQKGQDAHQGVGYLSDGTMVVVEQSSAYVGKTVHIEVIRSLQTAAGKMMFAKRIDDKKPARSPSGRAPRSEQSKVAQTSIQSVKVVNKKAHHHGPAPAHKDDRPLERAKPQQPRPKQSQPQQAQKDRSQSQQHTTPAQPTGSQLPRRRNTRRKDHEAALLALVDKQE